MTVQTISRDISLSPVDSKVPIKGVAMYRQAIIVSLRMTPEDKKGGVFRGNDTMDLSERGPLTVLPEEDETSTESIQGTTREKRVGTIIIRVGPGAEVRPSQVTRESTDIAEEESIPAGLRRGTMSKG